MDISVYSINEKLLRVVFSESSTGVLAAALVLMAREVSAITMRIKMATHH